MNLLVDRLPATGRFAAVLACLLVPAAAARAGEPGPFDPRLLEALPARSLGPANMSGRIVDVAVVEKRPSTMYVASASGGLWKTVNNGTTWDPVFDGQPVLSLGAVAVSQSNPDVVWVGTGEANPRNSVSPGSGVYKSTDGGKTWALMGLRDTQHVGRIVVHPTNPEVVYVAALGHVWAPNRERGLYKTTDGGKTWQLSKFLGDDTGFIDVAMDPSEPDTLYAAAWQVRRDAFAGGNPAVQTGPGSGLYRTTDGGKTWDRMTAGLPMRPLGRCGFSIYRKDPRVVYAVVQTDRTVVTVQGQPPNLKEVPAGQGKKGKRKVTPEDGGIFRSDDKGRTWKYLNSLVPRPFYYGQIRVDPADAQRVYVLGIAIRVDPADAQRVYVLGIAFHASDDGGKTFRPGNAAPGVHPDHHALWIDPRDGDHLVLGGDGGLYFSYDRGRNWEHLKNLPVAQFYAVAVDMRRPFRVYGGLQDNGSWGGPSATQESAGITFADWVNVLGSDGFQCQADPNDPDTVYAEAQYGRLARINLQTGATKGIQPRLASKKQPSNIRPAPPPGTPEYRFNWNSPLLLSPHNPRTVYYGGNHVFRSSDRGETWEVMGPDLTRGKPGPDPSTGHTLTTIAESPLRAGLLYAGSDDGRLHVSRDGGQNWTDLSDRLPGLPPERWVSRVVCSGSLEGVAYVTIDRRRNDDRRPYVFKTADHGLSWAPLAGNLPADAAVHVVREDPRRRDLLYAGTELGLFLSPDGGATWYAHRNGLPAVAVHDLVVHPRDQQLVIGTHGRGIYLMDVAPLQELTPKALQAAAYLFDVRPVVAFPPRHSRNWFGTRMFSGQNPPYGALLYYHLKEAAKGPLALTVSDADGKEVARLKLKDADRTAGFHRVVWDLTRGPRPKPREAVLPTQVAPGEYVVTLQAGKEMLRKHVRVLAE
jgi:photosystem II stability/assembly factor-like uncharacterized protein